MVNMVNNYEIIVEARLYYGILLGEVVKFKVSGGG